MTDSPASHRGDARAEARGGARERVSVLGIRHHGPGSARSVVAELDRLQPAIILIEGPADADPLLALAADPAMVPPVALLAYAPDEPRVSAFWPFAVFSPEWQALAWAAANGVPARFCDLPAGMVLAAAVGAETVPGPRLAGISFAPDGSSSGGRIVLADGGRRVQVGVDWLTGRVSVANAP